MATRKPKIDETEKSEKKTSEIITAFGGDFNLGDIGPMTVQQIYAPFEGIPTGSLTFDWALGGGIGVPRGQITQFVGEPGSGKTTALVMIGTSAVSQGMKVAVIPTEGRWPQEYAFKSGMGYPGKDYFMGEPLYGEGVCNLLVDLAEKGFDLALLDSVTAMSPKEEKDAGMDEQSYAKSAKLFSEFFRKRMYKITNSRMAVIMTNQLRTKIGIMYGNPESRPGGRALEYYCSVCVDFDRSMMDYESKADRDARRNPYGMTIRADVYKNSISPPYRPIELPIRFMNGLAIDQAEEIVEFGKQLNIFTGKTGGEISGGSQWWFKGELMGANRQEAKGKVANDPDLMVELTAKIREQMRLR